MKHLGDITKINGAEIEPVDVITGGSPCQDLSVAGKRAGLDGERSGLFMEQIRIIKEMRAEDAKRGRTNHACRPRFMVWENVPGALSSNGGEDFRIVLEETARIVEPNAVIPRPDGKWTNAGAIMGDGWSIAWRIHDAQFWGVPQRRRRIALVADFGGQCAAEVLFIRKGLHGDIEASGTARQGIAGDAKKSTRNTNQIRVNVFDASRRHDYQQFNDVIETVQASYGTGGNNQPLVVFDNIVTIEGNGTRGSHKGDGYKDTEIMYTLNTIEKHAVAYGISPFDSNAMKSGNPKSGIYKADTSRTLDLNGGSPACHQGGMAIVETYQEKTGTLTLDVCKHVGNQLANNDMFVSNGVVVRRLTPLECERLQGFPDGWTDIGEWTDTKGKVHKESSDSARYKALGNSIALPFWFWLLRRIAAQYERPATLGSLFDGIGGFPLCWERCNGPGMARWASEIEEFPIAVTKRHFPEVDNDGEEI